MKYKWPRRLNGVLFFSMWVFTWRFLIQGLNKTTCAIQIGNTMYSSLRTIFPWNFRMKFIMSHTHIVVIVMGKCCMRTLNHKGHERRSEKKILTVGNMFYNKNNERRKYDDSLILELKIFKKNSINYIYRWTSIEWPELQCFYSFCSWVV